jgi:hypothetical protein
VESAQSRLALVETSEQHRTEVNRPDAIIDFLQANVLIRESLGQMKPLGVPT